MELLYNRGVVTSISALGLGIEPDGCLQLVSVQDNNGNQVDFTLSQDTYLINHQPIQVGDFVTGYYDALAPTPLIYPPRYRAIVMVKEVPYQNVKVDFFNEQLISSDGRFKAEPCSLHACQPQKWAAVRSLPGKADSCRCIRHVDQEHSPPRRRLIKWLYFARRR